MQLHHGFASGPQSREVCRARGRIEGKQPVTLRRREEGGECLGAGKSWLTDLDVDTHGTTIGDRDDPASQGVRDAERGGVRVPGNVGLAKAAMAKVQRLRRYPHAVTQCVAKDMAHDEVRLACAHGGHGGRPCGFVLGPDRVERKLPQLNEEDVDPHASIGSRSGRPEVSRSR